MLVAQPVPVVGDTQVEVGGGGQCTDWSALSNERLRQAPSHVPIIAVYLTENSPDCQ